MSAIPMPGSNPDPNKDKEPSKQTEPVVPPEPPAVRAPKKPTWETVSDLMGDIQDIMQRVDNGTLEESKARVMYSGSKQVITLIGMQLQFNRMTRGKVPGPELRIVPKEPRSLNDGKGEEKKE